MRFTVFACKEKHREFIGENVGYLSGWNDVTFIILPSTMTFASYRFQLVV